jgi:hypothetical protein
MRKGYGDNRIMIYYSCVGGDGFGPETASESQAVYQYSKEHVSRAATSKSVRAFGVREAALRPRSAEESPQSFG